jgi:hypothetical protein
LVSSLRGESDHRFPHAARVPVRPMTGGDAEATDPMHVETAFRAVRHPCLELALEVGLHPQKLKPQHLRVDGDRVIASTSSLRLVNEVVGLRRLLGNGVDGVLEDLAFRGGACAGRLERFADLLEAAVGSRERPRVHRLIRIRPRE